VLASPVCEVGRDWDADWAVVEPSSIRSLIQLAGRLRRHRAGAVERPNMFVFDTNLRYFERQDRTKGAVFCQPGFELPLVRQDAYDPLDSKENSAAHFHLTSHELDRLLDLPEGRHEWPLDAQLRIRQNAKLKPKSSLIDLEHGRMRDTMLPRDESSKLFTSASRDATRQWYSRHPGHAPLWLTGVLPQLQRFRDDKQRYEDVALLPSEDEDELRLHLVVDERSRKRTLYTDRGDLLKVIPDADLNGPGIGPWCEVDLMDELRQYADAHDKTLSECARKLATATLPMSEPGWWFHPRLGFNKV
jgi:CRISPR-associated endonuclease/helicase Cas3